MYLNKSFIFILIKCYCFSSFYCQEETSCFEEYSLRIYDAELVSFTEESSNVSLLVLKVSENVYDILLYSIHTIDVMELTIDPSDETNTALEYISYSSDDTALRVQVVGQNLTGIMDYDNPNRKETLLFNVNFDFYNKLCFMEIRHEIIDENTAWAVIEPPDSEIYVREDFPTHLQIPNFQLMTHDYDATYPNNEYSVIINSGCPLQATELSYRCKNGVSVPMYFYLTEHLNYDIMKPPFSFNCTIQLLDKGDIPLISKKTIVLNVSPYPDEVPVFTSDFYTGYLFESVVGSTVRILPPIEATDFDLPSRPINYKMNYANNVSDVEYFSIDILTGVVTLTQDLDIDILLLESITYIITACDGDNQCAIAYLSIRLPLQSPSDSDALEFERDSYTVQVTSPPRGSTILWVHAQFSPDQEGIVYSLTADESSDLQYFEINENTGEITATVDNIPDYNFLLKAKASSTVGNLTDTAMVNIQVLHISDVVSVSPNIDFVSFMEYSGPIHFYTVRGTRASYFCIVDIQPAYFINYIIIDHKFGTLYTTQPLDADDPYYGNLVTIKVAAYSYPTSCLRKSDVHLLINEEILKVEISDFNDNIPYFVDQSGSAVTYLNFFYPEDKALQEAIGPIGKVLGRDNDVTADLRYEIVLPPPNTAIAFQINSITGELYFSYNWEFSDSSTFTVSVSDSLYTALVTVNVEKLPLNYISTMNFENLNMSEIERKISEVSDQIRRPLYLLYSNLVHYTDWGNYSKVQAHVYSYKDQTLYNWEELRGVIQAFGLSIEVQPFTDADLYDKQDFKTWTIVLGCITGLLVLVVVAAFTYTFWPKKLPTFNNVMNTSAGSQVLRDPMRSSNLSTTRKRVPAVNQEPQISFIPPSYHGASEIEVHQEPFVSFESSKSYSTNEPTVLLESSNSSELPNSSTSDTLDTIHEAASTVTLDTEVSSYDMQQIKDKAGAYPSLDVFKKEEEDIVIKPLKINSTYGHENKGFDIDSAHALESDSDSISDNDNKTVII